jgi:calcineurin-like phosphoesterase family protein
VTDDQQPVLDGAAPSRGHPVRDVALTLIVAVGTLALLVGLFALFRGGERSDTGDRPSASGAASQTTPPTSRPSAAASGIAPPSAATADAPSPGADPVIVGAGDIATCDGSGDEATAALLDGIAGTVFTAGDNAYDRGTPEEFTRCYEPSWGRHRERTRPAPGNHDHGTDNLAGYLGYFGAGVGTAREPWYSFDLGAWHVVVLDSMCSRVPGGCGPESPQVEWLIGDLARDDAACTLAIWHHPRFSSGEHGDDPAVAAFWQALHADGADVVINGHDHDYERFSPQTPGGAPDSETGIREFVVGTGGAPLRRFPLVALNSELRVSISHGVLALTLHDAGYDWRFLPTEGDFSDRGTAACH